LENRRNSAHISTPATEESRRRAGFSSDTQLGVFQNRDSKPGFQTGIRGPLESVKAACYRIPEQTNQASKQFGYPLPAKTFPRPPDSGYGTQGDIMVVVPLSKAENSSGNAPRAIRADPAPWLRFAAAGTLAASGALLATGKRRAGLVMAITGAVFVMIDQQEVVNAWWNALPGRLEEMQGFLGRAQAAVEDLSAEGEKLRRAFGK
jgi:hypothetical protein